jgi:hypothetical protein
MCKNIAQRKSNTEYSAGAGISDTTLRTYSPVLIFNGLVATSAIPKESIKIAILKKNFVFSNPILN